MNRKLRSNLMQQAEAAGTLGLPVAVFKSGAAMQGIRLTRQQTAAHLRQLATRGLCERICPQPAPCAQRFRLTSAGRERVYI